MTSKVSQVRIHILGLGEQGDLLLKVGGPKGGIAETDLRESLSALQSDLERRDEPQEEGAVQKLEVVTDTVRSNISRKTRPKLGGQPLWTGSLSRVSARQTKDLTEELFVTHSSSVTHPKVVLNSPLNDGLTQLLRNLVPSRIWMVMSERVSTVRLA